MSFEIERRKQYNCKNVKQKKIILYCLWGWQINAKSSTFLHFYKIAFCEVYVFFLLFMLCLLSIILYNIFIISQYYFSKIVPNPPLINRNLETFHFDYIRNLNCKLFLNIGCFRNFFFPFFDLNFFWNSLFFNAVWF